MIALALFAFQGFLPAQEVTASMLGTVTDPSGAPVAGAKVTATDVDRGTPFSTTTNEVGAYNLPRLPIGSYAIRVEHTGFNAAQQANITLELNQAAHFDVRLTLGDVSTQLNITDAAPVLQTETTQVGTVMESKAIAALPLETRNYNQLALLTPGAVTTSPGAFNTGQTTFNAGRPYINGNREQANYYLLDGLDNNEFVDNNVAFSPNVDAIQEFNVITNNPKAEFGQFLGGVISVSLKSGTNQYHGNLFEFIRNDFFNANEWSRNFSADPTVNSHPSLLRWNEFGGTFGGPIKKNKFFFFADYQGSRYDTPATPGTISLYYPGAHRQFLRPSGHPASLPRNYRSDALQPGPGSYLHERPEDGRCTLHQWPEPRGPEDYGRPSASQSSRDHQRDTE